ncbi:hypothetical protein NM208_g10500 [Fusarium decemcellulare]|uniref:Uncharacterized protein n=1 Tax=Fusarium decemcellulare TaxID=57161 RepID=A0ACC1RXP2_9HYPO|nr:hypothetical protein NM208_g10500 [Fusarium decemcellulare]
MDDAFDEAIDILASVIEQSDTGIEESNLEHLRRSMTLLRGIRSRELSLRCSICSKTVPEAQRATCPDLLTHIPVPGCDSAIAEFNNLPDQLADIATRVRQTVGLAWALEHRCQGEKQCNLFFMEDGTCVDPRCPNRESPDPDLPGTSVPGTSVTDSSVTGSHAPGIALNHVNIAGARKRPAPGARSDAAFVSTDSSTFGIVPLAGLDCVHNAASQTLL